MTPKETLIAGAIVLDKVLRPLGFVFEIRDEGRGSGGEFAWGEYVRDNRRLELHFRSGLGLVTYYVDDESAGHEPYMRGLGVWEQCRYPGFSAQPLDAFADLAADLGHADDFLSADASILRRVAAQERARAEAIGEKLMAGYVGDTAAIERMRSHFRAQRFRETVATFEALKYPQRLSPSDQKMVDRSPKVRWLSHTRAAPVDAATATPYVPFFGDCNSSSNCSRAALS
jgi:hypothetical protein